MKSTQSQRGFVVALAIGAVMLPAIAIALAPSGSRQVESIPQTDETPIEVVETPISVDAPSEAETQTLAFDASAADDVVFACRYAAEMLVPGNDAGLLVPLEIAALEALRPICAESGIVVPLTGPVAVAAPATTTAPPRTTTTPTTAAPATTQPPSTTTAPPTTTTPTTTGPPPAPGPAIGEYFVAGGSATLAFYEDSVEIIEIITNDGFKVETEREKPDEIDIKFESDGIDSFIFVTREDGEWRVVAVDNDEDEEDDD